MITAQEARKLRGWSNATLNHVIWDKITDRAVAQHRTLTIEHQNIPSDLIECLEMKGFEVYINTSESNLTVSW